MSINRIKRPVINALACVLAISGTALADAAHELNVPAGELTDALSILARQADVELVFQQEQVQGFRTEGLRGSYAVEEAIRILVKGTALQVHKDTSGAMVVSIPTAARRGGRLADTNAISADINSEIERSEVGASDLEEIVVTAQKRQELLKDVPISISVLSGQRLDSSTYIDVTEALRTIPGVDISVAGYQYNGGMLVAARGVSNAAARASGSTTVAYYVDGVPYGFMRNAFLPGGTSVYDLQQIEMLNGPQGTLYGAGALNGVLRVLTHDPDLNNFEVKARTSLSTMDTGGESYGGDAAVNVPLIEGKLAARATVGYHNNAGWIDAPNQNARDVNDSIDRNFRLKILGQPTDTFSIGFAVWRSDSDFGAPDVADDNARITAVVPQPGAHEFTSYALTLKKEFSAFSISSTSNYFDYQNFGVVDASPIPVAIQGDLPTELSAKIFSQEINLLSKSDGPWRWSAGVFYRDDKETTTQYLRFFPLSAPTLAFLDNFTDSSKSSAVFAEIGRSLSSQWELSVGVRYFRDEQSTRVDQDYSGHSGTVLKGTSIDSTAEAVTPRAVLKWTPSPEAMLYASYSQGFRSGIVQQPSVQANYLLPSAEPDKLINYEIGAKGALGSGLFSYEAAVFYIDWQDVQQTLQVIPGGGACNDCYFNAIVNGASASGLGASLNLVTNPVEGLELGVDASWNDLKLDADIFNQTPNGPVLVFNKGDRLSFSAEYKLGADIQYSRSIGGGGFIGRVGLSGDYTSAQDSATESGRKAGSGALRAAARLSLELPDNRWRATLFADNLTNTDGGAAPGAIPEWTARARPRTIGLQLEYGF